MATVKSKTGLHAFTEHPELPFKVGIVTVTLTEDQQRDLLPLVRRQVVDGRGLLFVSVAPFWHVEDGVTKLRLQAAFLDHKTSGKVLRLIREANGLTDNS